MTETIWQWAPSALLGLIGWLIRNSIRQFSDRVTRIEAEADARHEALVRELAELKDGKADREDHIRETARTRQSLEKLSEAVARIDGKLDSGIHIAAGINRLADAMEAQKDNG